MPNFTAKSAPKQDKAPVRDTLQKWSHQTPSQTLDLDRKESASPGPCGRLLPQGVMAYTKASQVEPFAYVHELLMRFAGDRPDELCHLLPAEWVKTHPEVRRSR